MLPTSPTIRWLVLTVLCCQTADAANKSNHSLVGVDCFYCQTADAASKSIHSLVGIDGFVLLQLSAAASKSNTLIFFQAWPQLHEGVPAVLRRPTPGQSAEASCQREEDTRSQPRGRQGTRHHRARQDT